MDGYAASPSTLSVSVLWRLSIVDNAVPDTSIRHIKMRALRGPLEDSLAFVELSGLTKRYGNLAVVKDVDLAVDKGLLVCLLGPSGCGKTTTLRLRRASSSRSLARPVAARPRCCAPSRASIRRPAGACAASAAT